ncbi:hypothetical protein ACTMU2_25635 [Cupriavidus basilensis]
MLPPLGVVLSNAGYQLLTGPLTRADGVGTTHFYTGGCVATLLLTAALPFAWVCRHRRPLRWPHACRHGAGRLCRAAMHLVFAYARAPVGVLARVSYLQIAFAMLGGWMVFSHVPDAWSLMGVAMIAASGVGGTAARSRTRPARGERPGLISDSGRIQAMPPRQRRSGRAALSLAQTLQPRGHALAAQLRHAFGMVSDMAQRRLRRHAYRGIGRAIAQIPAALHELEKKRSWKGAV